MRIPNFAQIYYKFIGFVLEIFIEILKRVLYETKYIIATHQIYCNKMIRKKHFDTIKLYIKMK